MQIIVNQLKHNRETRMDARLWRKFFNHLTDDFENVVCAIEESRNLEKMSIDNLKGSLEAHE